MERPGFSATIRISPLRASPDLERRRIAEDEHCDDVLVRPRVISHRFGGGEDRPQRFAGEVVAPQVLLAANLVDCGEGFLSGDLERRELTRLRVGQSLRGAGIVARSRLRGHCKAHDVGLASVQRRRVEDGRAVEEEAGLVVVAVAVGRPLQVGDRERAAARDQGPQPDVGGGYSRGRRDVIIGRRSDLGHRPVRGFRREGNRRPGLRRRAPLAGSCRRLVAVTCRAAGQRYRESTEEQPGAAEVEDCAHGGNRIRAEKFGGAVRRLRRTRCR